MSLTRSGLLWVLAAVAAALFVAVVSGWPRRGPAALRITGRALPVLALNGVVVLGCLAVLNDQYVFYTSWGDLLGARQAHAVAHHGGTTAAAFTAPVRGQGLANVGGPRDDTLPQPGQRMQHYTVHDPATGASVPVLVHLPVGYDPAASRTYPVILGLHGWPGVPQSFTRGRFLSTVDALTATHRLAASIVVIPQINDPRTIDTECVDGPPVNPAPTPGCRAWCRAGSCSHLHADPDARRGPRSATPTAAGARPPSRCATRTSSVAAVVFEGYFEPDFLAGYDPLGPAQLRGYDLVHLAAAAPPPIAMWVFASRQDALAYPTTARFLAAARSPLSVSATIVKVGGHRTAVYSPYVRPALMWLASTLPGFRP